MNPCGFICSYCDKAPVRADVSHLQSLKEAYGFKILRPLSTVVEWNEFRCKQLSHSYSTLWGKENEMP